MALNSQGSGELLLTIHDVSYSYKNARKAVDGIQLSLGAGVAGSMGPNGSGKSTLLRIAATVVAPHRGYVTWRGSRLTGGAELRRIRSEIGFAPQANDLPGHLTPWAAVNYAAWLKGIDGRARRTQAQQTLDMLAVSKELRNVPFARLSGGYQRRVVIACALVNNPALLVLDEPTAGLDQGTAELLREDLKQFKEGRVTILSTHLSEDVLDLCDTAFSLRCGVVSARLGRSDWASHPEQITQLARGN
jgi:ABC-2 type transport system ATP-binding protein